MSTWKENTLTRKARIHGSRRMATTIDKSYKHTIITARNDWRSILEENGWDDVEMHKEEDTQTNEE